MALFLINLDAFSRDDIVMKLDGEDYILPGEFSVEYFMQMWDIRQQLEENPEDRDTWERQYKFLYEIFSLKNDIKDYESFKKKFTPIKIGAFYRFFVDAFQSSSDIPDRIQETAEKKTVLEQKDDLKTEPIQP